MNTRILTVTQWGVAMDELHHAPTTPFHKQTLAEYLQNAVFYDDFRLKKECNEMHLYPTDMPKAIIRIQLTDTHFVVHTQDLWQQIDWLVHEKRTLTI